MEEKVIIKAETKKLSKILFWSWVAIGVALAVILYLTVFYPSFKYDLDAHEDRYFHKCDYESAFRCALSLGAVPLFLYCVMLPLVGCLPVGYLFALLPKTLEFSVTNKRVYGKTLIKTVDLPIDSINAVAKSLGFVSIATSSGRIYFPFMDNAKEVYNEINKLLFDRQAERKNAVIEENRNLTSIEELKKYKELLDANIITQEEFDAKKKQLL